MCFELIIGTCISRGNVACIIDKQSLSFYYHLSPNDCATCRIAWLSMLLDLSLSVVLYTICRFTSGINVAVNVHSSDTLIDSLVL